MATTTNYGWTTPDDTALVKDGASAIRSLGSSIDTTTKALNPSTTLGDMEYRSSTANTNTRLAIGTSGQVLTVNGSGVPAWTTISSGGMTLISTTTLTGSSVNITSIPATYKDLVLVVRNYRPSTADGLKCRINGDSTANRHNYDAVNNASMAGVAKAFTTTSFTIQDSNNTSAGTGLSYTEFFDYTNTATWKFGRFWSITTEPTNTAEFRWYNGAWAYNQTGAISSLTLFPNSGTFS